MDRRTMKLLGMCVVATLTALPIANAASAPNPTSFDAGLDNQLGLTFSPDGSQAFWVAWNGNWGGDNATQRRIFYSQTRNGDWSAPEPMEFSGTHSDGAPFVSADGRWLYFVSDRPTDANDKLTDANIWRYDLELKNEPDLVPVNSDAEEYSPVVTSSGTLFFASSRDGGQGAGDLYRAVPVDDGFGTPQALGTALNSPTGEWNLWVSGEEDEIIFEASSRPTNVSIPGDLYYSWRTASGWTSAVPINALNSSNSDLMPRMHPDGETLFYTSAPIGGHATIKETNWTELRRQLRSEFAER